MKRRPFRGIRNFVVICWAGEDDFGREMATDCSLESNVNAGSVEARKFQIRQKLDGVVGDEGHFKIGSSSGFSIFNWHLLRQSC